LARAKELQAVLNDSASSAEAKESAKQQLQTLEQQYVETAKLAEAEDKHEIVQGALTKYVTGLKGMGNFFDESSQLWTGEYEGGGSEDSRRHKYSAFALDAPYTSTTQSAKKTRAREYGNVFDLNSEKYNEGWFKDDNKYSNSDVDDLFNHVANVVMIPSENGNVKAVEEYLFKNLTNYGGDQSGYDLPSKFRIKSTAQFLGEYDPMLKE